MISNYLKFFSIQIFMVFISVAAFCQNEEFEEPDLEAPSNIKESAANYEENIMNQLDKLNEISSSNVGFESFIYSERGRRSPFFKPGGLKVETSELTVEKRGGLEGYEVSNFQLTTIMWDVKHPKAIVKTLDKQIYLIEEGTKIGRSNGYVAKIREGEVIIVEPSSSTESGISTVYKTQVLKLGR